MVDSFKEDACSLLQGQCVREVPKGCPSYIRGLCQCFLHRPDLSNSHGVPAPFDQAGYDNFSSPLMNNKKTAPMAVFQAALIPSAA